MLLGVSRDTDLRICCHRSMTDGPIPLSAVLSGADAALSRGEAPAPRVWGSGFPVLDRYLGGGLRAGELTLLGGPQGLGKTTFAMQVIRNIAARGGDVVYFAFEHDAQSLLERWLCLEAAEVAGVEGMTLEQARQVFERADGAEALEPRLAEFPGGKQALGAIGDWGERVHLYGAGMTLTLEDVEQVVAAASGQPVVVVDYLQKVRGSRGKAENEQAAEVVEGLKDIALRLEVPVLAVVAADREGIAEGHRLRVHQLRGTSALAYEADVILLMNDKYDIVARHHLVYDVANAERFRDWVVVTIEKNRGGANHIDLEFAKRFPQACFDPNGRAVAEQLVNERVFVE